MKSLRFLSAALAALAVCAAPAYAQPDPPPVGVGINDVDRTANDRFDADPPPVTQRVSALERENVLLKARVAALEKGRTAPPIPAASAAVPDLYVLNGRYVSRTEFYAAPGVASSAAPFGCQDCKDNCPDGACLLTGCAAGCSTTPTIGATGAGTRGMTLTYGLGRSARAGTSTGAGCAATSGGTSGCANGSCAAPARQGWYLGKNLGR